MAITEGKRLTTANIPQLYVGEEAAVILVLQSLLDFISHRDVSKIANVYFPSAGTARWRPTGMVIMPMGELVESIAKLATKADEYMWDPEFQFCGNLCMVWVSCRVNIEGSEPYYAKNCVSFHKEDGVWKISGVADTVNFGEAST